MAVWSVASLQSVIDTRRIDADHYRPEYLKITASLTWAPALKQFVQEIIHPAEFSRRYSDNGWKVVRTQNVRPLRMDFESNEVFLSEEIAKKLNNNQLRSEDILITRTGANFGQCSLFYAENQPAIATSHTFIVRVNDKIDSAYLALFLNTTQGRQLIDRGMYGSSQPEIAPRFLLRIPTPRFDESIEAEMAMFVRKAYDLRNESISLYKRAQYLLESELGLDKLSFRKPVGYMARFSELEQSRRLDPEHFYPAFKHLVKHLPARVTLTPLFKLIEPCQTGVQPTYSENGTVPVINSRHVLCNKIDHSSCRRAFEIDRVAMAQRGDVLLNATGAGTLGRASALLTESARIFDVCIVRIRPHSIDPVYLAAFLNTIPGQLQIERHTRGSSGQLHLYPRDVAKIQVWKAPESFQTEVRRLIEEAHKAEKDADQFLAEAKTRVEQLIEEAVRR